MSLSLPTFEKRRLLIGVTLISIGFTLFFQLISLPALLPIPLAVLFVLLPVIWLFDDAFPLVESASSGDSRPDPITSLRRRYARGEIDEDEFERRLTYLLQTEDSDGRTQKGQNRNVEQAPEFEIE
jgi:uncharacterized membrane protein